MGQQLEGNGWDNLETSTEDFPATNVCSVSYVIQRFYQIENRWRDYYIADEDLRTFDDAKQALESCQQAWKDDTFRIVKVTKELI